MTMTDEARAAIAAAQAEPLGEKIAKAIDFLQFHEALTGGAGYYLAFSGGKDSIVIKALAGMAGVRFDAWYNQTTIDPPELIRFIKEHHADVQWNRNPKGNLIRQMVTRGKCPPTRMGRWCCSEYKEQGGSGRIQVTGVRASESPRRAADWSMVVKRRHGAVLCPILYWTDEDVWAFIRHFGLPYPSLYDEGFTRLGCVGCPMATKKNREKEFARWPGFARLWFRSMAEAWAKWRVIPNSRTGAPRYWAKFASPEAMWKWWMQDDEAVAPCQYADMFGTGDNEEE